jgi:hypothetical protein
VVLVCPAACPAVVVLLSLCCPTGLFALREVCKLLEADVGLVLQLVEQEPELLDVPARSLQDNIRVRHISLMGPLVHSVQCQGVVRHD